MTAATLFDRIDQAGLAIATERFGFAFMSATFPIAAELRDDPRVSPTALVAGMCKAHAAGLAPAIVSAAQLHERDPHLLALIQSELIHASFAHVRDELAGAGAGGARVQ